ncbi:MAG: ACP S-malonyltransferase [Bacteroidales bacterium]|nr:ACP S-malonyltransferase [Bacteroidales bacterium]
MKAYIFPGQGAQFVGMGKELYNTSGQAKEMFEKANDILGFRITDIMFEGTDEDLKQTKVTQPAIFLHSTILATTLGDDYKPDMVAGHSLGEFSALVANKSLLFEDGLTLVSKRAMAMQKACEAEPSTMAAILGMEDKLIEQVCNEIDDIVVPANYNSPGQVVISGSLTGVQKALDKLREHGAKRVIQLKVGGAFHSPLMIPAKNELEKSITQTLFSVPACPVYQNATAKPSTDIQTIRKNLIDQLTSPVKWTQTVRNMLTDGASSFTEVGPGKVLQGLVKKVDPNADAQSA